MSVGETYSTDSLLRLETTLVISIIINIIRVLVLAGSRLAFQDGGSTVGGHYQQVVGIVLPVLRFVFIGCLGHDVMDYFVQSVWSDCRYFVVDAGTCDANIKFI